MVALGWAACGAGRCGVCIVLVLASLICACCGNGLSHPAGAIGMLVLLMIVDSERFVSRWITIGGFSFQPLEPAKIAVIMALARYFDEQPAERMQSLLVYFHRCC